MAEQGVKPTINYIDTRCDGLDGGWVDVYWASRVLLSAVEVGVFAALAGGPLQGNELRERTGLHQRGARDLFDALVALGLLDRDDHGYRNTTETGVYLDPAKPTYLGGGLPRLDGRRGIPAHLRSTPCRPESMVVGFK